MVAPRHRRDHPGGEGTQRGMERRVQTRTALKMTTGTPAPEPWHFDRKVPIALIATIVVQTVAVVWWASGIHHRVATVEAMQLVLGARTTSIEAASRTEVAALRSELQTRNERTLEGQRSLAEQIIEQRGDVKAIRAILERLERQMDRASGKAVPTR